MQPTGTYVQINLICAGRTRELPAMAEVLIRFHPARFLGYEAAGACIAGLPEMHSGSSPSPGFAPAPGSDS